MICRQQSPRLNPDFELAVLVMGLQRLGRADIPLAIWRVLQKLAIFVAVPFWNFDGAGRLYYEHSQRRIFHYPVNRSTGNDQIISLAERQRAEHGLQPTGALVNK